MTCPHCHQDAPSIVRGGRVCCSACGASRSTAAEAANLSGQPFVPVQPLRIGGGIASVLGWVVLSIGLMISLGLGGLAYLLWAMTGALWIGGTIGVLTLLVALPLLLGGRRLTQAGEDRARAAQEHAVFGLAARRRGVLTVREVAGALSVREDEADSLLTTLAKRPDGRVTLELDDNGGISYLFHDLRPATRAVDGGSPGAPVRVRVPEQPWTAPARVIASSPPPRVIDAELIDEDDALARPGAMQETPASRQASR